MRDGCALGRQTNNSLNQPLTLPHLQQPLSQPSTTARPAAAAEALRQAEIDAKGRGAMGVKVANIRGAMRLQRQVGGLRDA